MSDKIRILYVDDYKLDRELVKDALEKEHGGFEITEASNRRDFEALLKNRKFDAVLSDFNIAGFEGLQVLENVLAHDPRIPVIIVTGTGSEEIAVMALKQGAADYVIKRPKHILKLPQTILTAIEKQVLKDQHMQAEEKMRENEIHLRTLIRTIPDLVWLKDPQGTYLACNPRFESFFGATEKDIVGKTDYDFVDKELADFFRKNDKIAAAKRQPIRNEEEVIFADDGHREILETIKTPMYGSDGQLAGVLGIGRDITERKQAEDERALLISAVEQASESIIISNGKGTIQYVNPSFEQLSGFNQEDVIGQNIRILKSDKHDDAFYRDMYGIISRGKMWSGRITNKMKNGTLHEFETRISPIRDNQGKIINYVSVNRDITQMLELESQLRQSQKMEAIGLLAGGIAHDFNNLLTTIIGYADFALEQASENSSLYNEIDEIRKAGRQAANLTRQLLTFSRKQFIQLEILNLNDILTNTEKMLRRTIGEDIEIKTVFEPDLWNVKMDPGQIEQVLLNLVVNARDAMPEGGKLTVETANVELDDAYFQTHGVKSRRGSYVMMSVTDTGEGMDEKIRSRIFEPFFTTKERGQGTGLGLSTVYGIVKQNNGHIWAYSEPGKGTTFKIYFPQIPTDEIPDNKTQIDDTLSTGSETILVVEDNEMLLKLTQKMLEKYGYKALTARSGNKAMEIFNRHDGPIQLLLTDVVMPDMNGRELAEQIQSGNPKVKVIYMSGYTDETISKHGVLYDDVEFIEKPFSPKDLRLKVRKVLTQKIGKDC